MKRIPEPELMDSEAQTIAYAEADFEEANSLFTQRFLDRFTDLDPAGKMADLGCGPGDIAIRMASALPGWRVTGIDAGENMLRRAQERLHRESLDQRVDFRLAYLPDPSLPKNSFDAVISNSLLHHLPDPQVLWQSIGAVGCAGAAIQVMDLSRPDNEAAAQDLVDRYADGAPEILREDFYNSLLAAYTMDEIRAQLDRAGLDMLSVESASDRHWIVSGRL
ncbi:MAG: methyltransferase domain-containing protein [Xanthomonadales bacterium]|jgi:ubiquinone/menaquinone biosynthesis C-methylase UbiE|nr:methyltransferase domain-containing protein [Xanthomonadales bacterium]MDH4001726.1 methyltransferase domain-containing protein [Xanthomonadales bacterium]